MTPATSLGVFQIGAVVPSVQHHPFAVRHHPLDSVEPLAPRLCFAGSADEIDYGERWGGVRVRLARPLLERRPELERYGWDVGYFALGGYGWFTQGLLDLETVHGTPAINRVDAATPVEA
jgi:hypothetical protein